MTDPEIEILPVIDLSFGERSDAAGIGERSEPARKAADDWSCFDPTQCRFADLIKKLEEIELSGASGA